MMIIQKLLLTLIQEEASLYPLIHVQVLPCVVEGNEIMILSFLRFHLKFSRMTLFYLRLFKEMEKVTTFILLGQSGTWSWQTYQKTQHLNLASHSLEKIWIVALFKNISSSTALTELIFKISALILFLE